MFFLILWQIIIFVQMIFSYGTAYRLTKNGGDNGVALYGWILLMSLASAVPGLGIYLWHKYRDADAGTQYDNERAYVPRYSANVTPVEQQNCSRCARSYDHDRISCPHCGNRP